MEYFQIYLNSFKKSFDYKNPSPRKELNSFILFYFLFWMLIFIPFMFSNVYTTMVLNKTPEINFIIYLAVSWLFFIIHAFPLLGLVKRRLIDITNKNANLIFGGYIVVEIIRISIVIAFIFLFAAFFKTVELQNIFLYIAIGLVNQLLSASVLAFYIFLMVKKGNL